jgi:hypothetical protein
MSQTHASFRATRRQPHPHHIWPGVAAMVVGVLCLLPGTDWAARATSVPSQMKPIPLDQIVTFLFLMLGPVKIIGPFVKATQAADARLARQIAFRAILFSSLALLLAALLGESILNKYSTPLPVLAISAGVILFLVALQGILQQFVPPAKSEVAAAVPTPSVAITPIAFPTIVTPYGVAALIIFIALSPSARNEARWGPNRVPGPRQGESGHLGLEVRQHDHRGLWAWPSRRFQRARFGRARSLPQRE